MLMRFRAFTSFEFTSRTNYRTAQQLDNPSLTSISTSCLANSKETPSNPTETLYTPRSRKPNQGFT